MERKLEKQLNRLAFLAGVKDLAYDDEKIVQVLKSIALGAQKMNFVILPIVKRKACVVCSTLIRKPEEIYLDCGHFICSIDCLAEVVNSHVLSETRILCPIKSCEITTPKSKILENSEREIDLQEMLILCPVCCQAYSVLNSLKLPCGHRFCLFCIFMILNQQNSDLKNKCSVCLEEITVPIIQKLKNSPQLITLINS